MQKTKLIQPKHIWIYVGPELWQCRRCHATKTTASFKTGEFVSVDGLKYSRSNPFPCIKNEVSDSEASLNKKISDAEN